MRLVPSTHLSNNGRDCSRSNRLPQGTKGESITTEQKIREAYELAVNNDPYISSLHCFRGGYLAALNDLEIVSVSIDRKHLYRLPEGVEK